MGLFYYSGFQVGGANSMTMNIGTGVTISDGYYLPGNLSTSPFETTPGTSYAGQAYSPFATEVAAKFSAATGTAFTVTLSDGAYTISRSTNFSLSYSTAAEKRLMAALGFNSSKSGASTYTSDATARYICESAIGGRTDVQGPFQPDDMAEESVSDGGDPFVVKRKSSELLMSWVQSMEPKTSVYDFTYTMDAYTVPGTWENWWRNNGGIHPFVIFDTGMVGETEGSLYQLTARGASFRPRKVTADFDDQWIVPFDARRLGVSPP